MTKLLGSLALALGLVAGLASVSASDERNGQLHVTKECSQYTGLAGGFCTITSSNLAEIKVGTKVYYAQPFGIPAGMLDSNVVLHVGTGDWAVGRCTLDSRQYPGNYGLCTFSNGVGSLAGFTARVNVSPFENTPTDVNYYWNGTYSFRPDPGI